MNRRSFFRSIARGVLATAAALYAPRLLEADGPERMTFDWENGLQVPSAEVYLARWERLRGEVADAWSKAWDEMAAEIMPPGSPKPDAFFAIDC